ncbi:unnamed protein product [Discosporangium mesarthrocarpum]
MGTVLRALRLNRVPIFQQLCIEEALFYKTDQNWLLYNEGSQNGPPTIVLGISGKPKKMCNLELVHRDEVPLVKRFSGGGTVVVDHNTVFSTLIMNQDEVKECKPYPRDIMEWSKTIYGPAFKSLAPRPGTELGLRENDYVFGDLKFGGNAQAITRGRWLHHTSFLWGFDATNMLYLQLPEKRPVYRGDRDHNAFLTPLKNHLRSKDDVWPAFKSAAERRFQVEEVAIEEVMSLMEGAEGVGSWMEQCRTKFVGLDGKPLPPPDGGHGTL